MNVIGMVLVAVREAVHVTEGLIGVIGILIILIEVGLMRGPVHVRAHDI